MEIVCPYCSFSKSVPDEKIPRGAKTAICPRCRQRFAIPGLEKPVNAPPAQDKDRTPPPWERRSELGLGRAFRESVKGVLFSPALFFRRMTVGRGILEPLAIGILMGSLGMMFEIVWQSLTRFGDLPILRGGWIGKLTWGPLLTLTMVLCPVIVTIFICVASLGLHVLLVIVRGAKNGFEATLRAVSYGQATQLWAVIPFIGSFLAGIWFTVVMVVGLREIHGISYVKVILALLIPFVAMMVLLVAVLIPFLLSLFSL